MTKLDDNIAAVFEFAHAHPDGFKKSDLCAETGMSMAAANKAIQGVRNIFANDSTTLTCVPAGRYEEWTYRLVDTMKDGGGFWVDNRMRDARARFTTLKAVTSALVHATDGRTKDGRVAREMHLTASQLLERLDMIEEVYT